ncbi:MAG: SDR family oxidoreductase [Alphaproteobacteria bacterium]|nr:SDR family oxidoreductase [Alphaproteobacteria bacterium]
MVNFAPALDARSRALHDRRAKNTKIKVWETRMTAFAGKTVLITGAGSGMGRSHAQLFAGRGASVIVHDIHAGAVAETCTEISRAGGRAVPMIADIRNLDTFRRALAPAVEQAGAVDILVNNAGVSGRRMLVENISEDLWDEFMAVHVRGAFFATQAVLPSMKEQGWGRIINISSQWGIAGSPSASHYAGAKAALIGYTKAWAREFAPFGITVNSVAPGYILTPMTAHSRQSPDSFSERLKPIPVGRAGEPIDISYCVCWLASDEAEFVTGHVLNASGGEVI